VWIVAGVVLIVVKRKGSIRIPRRGSD